METPSVTNGSSNVAQDVLTLRQSMMTNLQLHKESMAMSIENMQMQTDRTSKNAMRNEVVSILSDVMTTMKKTGEEARSSGR